MGKSRKAEVKPKSVAKALHEVANDADIGDREINHITVRLLANGDVTYRMHDREHEDYVGGFIAGETA